MYGESRDSPLVRGATRGGPRAAMACPAIQPLRQHENHPCPSPVTADATAHDPSPGGAELLELERQVRRSGSGLTAAELQGCWQLEQVWPKGSRRPASFSSQLLRGLGARLEIIAAGEALTLTNAVTLGPLILRFRGPGTLKGRRPLLEFHFHTLELCLGPRLLLQRSLPEPAARRRPFFALIGRHAAGWLAARGRGGGLALWRLRAS